MIWCEEPPYREMCFTLLRHRYPLDAGLWAGSWDTPVMMPHQFCSLVECGTERKSAIQPYCEGCGVRVQNGNLPSPGVSETNGSRDVLFSKQEKVKRYVKCGCQPLNSYRVTFNHNNFNFYVYMHIYVCSDICVCMHVLLEEGGELQLLFLLSPPLWFLWDSPCHWPDIHPLG